MVNKNKSVLKEHWQQYISPLHFRPASVLLAMVAECKYISLWITATKGGPNSIKNTSGNWLETIKLIFEFIFQSGTELFLPDKTNMKFNYFLLKILMEIKNCLWDTDPDMIPKTTFSYRRCSANKCCYNIRMKEETGIKS